MHLIMLCMSSEDWRGVLLDSAKRKVEVGHFEIGKKCNRTKI